MKRVAIALLLCVFSLSLLAADGHRGGPPRKPSDGPATTKADVQFLEENFPLSKEDAEWFVSQLLDESTAGAAAAELILSLDETEEHKDQTAFHDKISADPGPEGLSEDLKKALKWGAVREKTEKHSDKATEEFKKKYDDKRKEKLDCNKTYNDTQEKFKKGEIGYNEAKKELQKCQFSDDVLQKYSNAKYNQNTERTEDLPGRAQDALFLSGINKGGRVLLNLSASGEARKILMGYAAEKTPASKAPPQREALSGIWSALTSGKSKGLTDKENPTITFETVAGTGGGKPMIWTNSGFEEDKDWARSRVPSQFIPPPAETAKHPLADLVATHPALKSCNTCHGSAEDTLAKITGFKGDHAKLVEAGKVTGRGAMAQAVQALPADLQKAITEWAAKQNASPK